MQDKANGRQAWLANLLIRLRLWLRFHSWCSCRFFRRFWRFFRSRFQLLCSSNLSGLRQILNLHPRRNCTTDNVTFLMNDLPCTTYCLLTYCCRNVVRKSSIDYIMLRLSSTMRHELNSSKTHLFHTV